MRNFFLCTRPRLAALLMARGATVHPVSNPFARDDTHRQAWDVSLTDKSAAIIRNFYMDIGKPVPASVAEYISEGEANG